MKKYILFNIIVLTALLGCDDLLEENPSFTLNEQTLFKTKESAQLALNACYGWVAHHQMYGQGLINVTELASGIAWARKNPGNDESNMAAFEFLPDGFYPTFLWDGLYKAISETNIFIAAAENSSIENKEHLMAQAKFLRGLAYYNLAYIWGGVPLKLTPPTAETTDVPRATRKEVIEQVIKDFNDAAENLNETEEDSSIPSKLTTWSMLAKVYFLEASAEGVGSSLWSTARDFGEKVFAVVGTAPPLEPVYADLFNENTRESVESLFKLNYSPQGTGRSFNKNGWMQSPYFSTVGGKHFPNRRVSKAHFNYFRSRHPGDPRIDASYFHTTYVNALNGNTENTYPIIAATGNRGTWPYFKKHHDSRIAGQFTYKNFIVLRYADLLLLMADVENELGNTGVAVGYVNQVLARARASVSPAALEPADVPLTISQQDLRQLIFDERLFELGNEGHSFIETRRRGIEYLGSITQRHNAEPDAIPGFESSSPWSGHRLPESGLTLERTLLMPIPQKEINNNKAIDQSNQNIGW
ncbi:RagB/SusD family nutrient uptake outer membrane protein [Fulvivirgaceae bacterium BMA12]|uniref:RagB/SusD family nutrient uptake outer membrane protein n=1 Tax=Agaribacillus aureus TaxID=3051825 RepID=A0ABT8L9F4_9BACT|nr:RagB/SusD family nutrient uptake outer membrane protein [Fulvivirgaceae bacterium BMA12]